MNDSPRDSLLPKGAPNPIVWCERCQRHHRYHTFTQEDYDTVISEGVTKLADAIDARAMDAAFRDLDRPKP